MSKPVKEMIMAEYRRRFEELEGALVIAIRGIEANDNNELRQSLAEKDIHITVLKNTLAKARSAARSSRHWPRRSRGRAPWRSVPSPSSTWPANWWSGPRRSATSS